MAANAATHNDLAQWDRDQERKQQLDREKALSYRSPHKPGQKKPPGLARKGAGAATNLAGKGLQAAGSGVSALGSAASMIPVVGAPLGLGLKGLGGATSAAGKGVSGLGRSVSGTQSSTQDPIAGIPGVGSVASTLSVTPDKNLPGSLRWLVLIKDKLEPLWMITMLIYLPLVLWISFMILATAPKKADETPVTFADVKINMWTGMKAFLSFGCSWLIIPLIILGLFIAVVIK